MLVKRVGHSLCFNQDKVYCVGGKSDDKICTKLCESYDVKEDRWEYLPNLNHGRSKPGLCLVSQRYLYTFFGSDSIGIINNTIEFIDLYNLQIGWTLIQIQNPLKR